MAKLNQVIAVEKQVKTRVQQSVDALYKALQKPALFDGAQKSYKPLLEDEPGQPTQSQKVQMTVPQVLESVRADLLTLFDIVAQKDFSNTNAKADIELGTVLVTGVPTTYLLFLEKQLTDLYTLVSKLPTLDPSEEWTADQVKRLFKTVPVQVQRTKKVAKPLVLYPATPEHPAQTQVIHEDIPVGTYETVKFSGATTEEEKETLLKRIVAAQQAVKFAREKANNTDAPKQTAGEQILNWIFA